VTYMFILKCALKLVEEIILYYDARLKKHQNSYCSLLSCYISLHMCTATNVKFSTMKMGHLTKALIWNGGCNRAHCMHTAAENWDVLRQVTLKLALLFTIGGAIL